MEGVRHAPARQRLGQQVGVLHRHGRVVGGVPHEEGRRGSGHQPVEGRGRPHLGGGPRAQELLLRPPVRVELHGHHRVAQDHGVDPLGPRGRCGERGVPGQVPAGGEPQQDDPPGPGRPDPAHLGAHRVHGGGVPGVHGIAEDAGGEAEAAEPLGHGFALVVRVPGVPAAGEDDDVRSGRRRGRSRPRRSGGRVNGVHAGCLLVGATWSGVDGPAPGARHRLRGTAGHRCPFVPRGSIRASEALLCHHADHHRGSARPC